MLRFVCLFLIVISPFTWSAQTDDRLKEAKDYLTVKPSESLHILQEIADTSELNDKQQIEWYILNMRASLPLGKLDNLIQSVNSVFKYRSHPYFAENITSITSALGIWLRRNRYLIDAEISFKCSYQSASNDRLRVILNNSLALLAREVGDLERAKSLFEYSAKMAKADKNLNMMGMISFNQGLIAFDAVQVAKAEIYFRKALEYYQAINKGAGKVRVGTYLLFAFVVQKELTNYQRLYLPTYQQSKAFPNEATKALLAWVNAGYMHQTGKLINSQMRDELLKHFTKISDYHEQLLVIEHLAKPLGIALTVSERKPQRDRFQAEWFELVEKCHFA